MEGRLLVSEVFGPTFQGEGKHTGRLAAFVRLGGCNLHCWWCDTPYTWVFDDRHANMHRSKQKFDPREELVRMWPDEIIEHIRDILPSGGLVVFSGGEPMLQQEGLFSVIDGLYREVANQKHSEYFPEIETAGTIQPTGDLEHEGIQWNVSPKLEHSGNSEELRYKPDVLRWFAETGDAMFKFVVQSEGDLLEVEALVNACGIKQHQVWIMPEGTTADLVTQRMKYLAGPVLERGWNLTTRLHTLIWEDLRGH
jgi:organic radical activating enzyme